MLCDTCTKATVCRLKEDCNRLERSISGNHVEDILSVDVKCKEYQGKTLAQGIKSPVRFPEINKPFTWDKLTCEASNASLIAAANNHKRYAYDKNIGEYVEIVKL